MKNIFTTISIILVLSHQAQITIGSKEEPNPGAIVDIKQEGKTTKGLALPRVKLIKQSDLDLSKTIEGVKAGTYSGNNKGLMIYNINGCIGSGQGIYVWDGENWNSLNSDVDKSFFDPITEILTDYEGNQYTTKIFRGKRWMTQNLRSIRKFDGSVINCNEGLYINPAAGQNETKFVKITSEIPNSPSDIIPKYTNAGVVIENQSYKDFIKDFGLLYNWNSATIACPKGWHLPTNDEWDALAQSFGGIKVSGHPSNGYYREIQHQMKTNNGKTYVSTNGIGHTWGQTGVVENGFNAIPSGGVDSVSNGLLKSYHFGAMIHMWSKDIYNNRPYVWVLSTGSYSNANMLSYNANGYYANTWYSTRCVQD